jgi:hypothetical protein
MSAHISPVENTVGVNAIQVQPTVFSLNEIIQQVIKEYNTQRSISNTIIRCETLPSIKARKEQLTDLFKGLLGTIFNEVPNGSKLFLYIDSRDDFEKTSAYHEVLINTNITSCEEWSERHHQILDHCKDLAKRIGGTLQVNINSSGCVFVISLPR